MGTLRTQNIDEDLISKMVGIISSKFHPKKIVLFGSRAWGNSNPESDIDLFIIMPSSLRRDDRSMEISKLFSDRRFPLDVLVYTPQEVEMSIKRKNPFIREVLEKGKVLYEG